MSPHPSPLPNGERERVRGRNVREKLSYINFKNLIEKKRNRRR